jgi:hypothetical protein
MLKWVLSAAFLMSLVTFSIGCRAEGEIDTASSVSVQ